MKEIAELFPGEDPSRIAGIKGAGDRRIIESINSTLRAVFGTMGYCRVVK